MPFANPNFHKSKTPHDHYLAEALVLLDHIGRNAAYAGQGGSPRTANPNPLAIDTAAMARINKALDDEAGKRFQTTFDKCELVRKAEILKAVLEVGGTLGLSYDRRMGLKPQTLTEFLGLEHPAGNCADFSRLLVAVAREKGLPVQMLSVTFQAQDGGREEEQHLAVFNIGDKIYYIDLSNQALRSYPGFTSTADLVKYQKFRDEITADYKKAVKDGRDYTIAGDPVIITTQESYQATYWADIGHFHFQKKDWKPAIEAYSKARDLGLDTYWVNSELGGAYFGAGEYKKAIESLQRTSPSRRTPKICEQLAGAHFSLALEYQHAAKYDEAIKEFTAVADDPTLLPFKPTAEHLLGKLYHTQAMHMPTTGNAETRIRFMQDSVRALEDAFSIYSTTDQNFNALKTDLSKAYRDLVVAYIKAEKIPEAKEALTYALEECKRRGLPNEGLLQLEKVLSQ